MSFEWQTTAPVAGDEKIILVDYLVAANGEVEILGAVVAETGEGFKWEPHAEEWERDIVAQHVEPDGEDVPWWKDAREYGE